MDEIEDLKNQIKILSQKLNDANYMIKSLEDSLQSKSFENFLNHKKKKDSRTDLIYNNICDSLIEGVVFFNAQGKVEIINEGAKEITGLNFLELQKKIGDTRFNPVDENYQLIPFQDWPAVTALNSKKQVKNFQVGVKLKGKTYQWLLVNSSPVFNSNREFLGIVSSIIDISEIKLKRDELKQAKLNLEISENSLKIAQEIAHVGNFILHLKNNKVEMSDESYRIFGLSKYDLIDDLQFYIDKFLYSEDQQKIKERVMLLKQQKPVEPIEFRIKLPNGKIRILWSHVGKVILDNEGNPDIVVGVLMDITNRRKEEERKLESLRFLAGGIAHDFNNLLGGIYGFIDLAVNGSHESLVQSYLKGALKTMGRARSLTDQLLTFTDGGLPNREVTTVGNLIVKATNFILSGTSVICDFSIPENLWFCEIDKVQIEQVIENIVLNAIQSMGGKGKIFISAENVINAELPKATKSIKITIRDTGSGMTKDILDHLFEPFFTTKEKGHGLGLTTCYSIVKKHDGLINVDSQINKGSTFTIYIPATEKSVEIKKTPITKSYQGKGLIIVLDDEEDICEILTINLQKLGYSVIAKTKGEEVLEIVNDKQIIKNLRALFLDLTIPFGLGGKDLIADLRRMFPTLPIFVISGYAEDPIISKPEDYGFTASLKKPFLYAELEKMLSSYNF